MSFVTLQPFSTQASYFVTETPANFYKFRDIFTYLSRTMGRVLLRDVRYLFSLEFRFSFPL